MKILNLYSGIGGNRKLWGDEHEITAVEYNKDIASVYQSFYPDDTVIVGDAHQYLIDHVLDGFDFIWTSPPCQSHSKMAKFTRHSSRKYTDMKLYQEIIFLDNHFKGKWCVENVVPYYEPLIPGKKIGRHIFWSNFYIPIIQTENAKDFINLGSVSDSEKLKDFLGLNYKGNLYYEGNHDPCQVLRNCVHPRVGKHVLDMAIGNKVQDGKQMELF